MDEQPLVISPQQEDKPMKKMVVSIWPLLTFILLILFIGQIVYQMNTDFKKSINQFFGIKSVENTVITTPDLKTPQINTLKIKVVYNKDDAGMKDTIDAYFKKMETSLQNTKVDSTMVDYRETEGQALLSASNKIFLPLFFMDKSVEDHPSFDDFKPYLEDVSGQYLIKSEGYRYTKTPEIDSARVLGAKPESSKVKIIEYISLTCVHCKEMAPVMDEVLKTYPQDVTWVIKNYDRGWPDTVLAQAAECSADQSKYQAVLDSMYENQDDFLNKLIEASKVAGITQDKLTVIVDDFIKTIAQKNGLNLNKLNQCLKAKTYESKVADQTKDGINFNVNGTPGLFVNDRFIGGSITFENIKKIIDEEIAKK